MTVVELAVQGRLSEALDELGRVVREEPTSWELQKEYHDIVSLYHTLLDYFRQGADDPERQRVYTRLIGRTLILNDRLNLPPAPPRKEPEDFGAPSLWDSSREAEAIRTIRQFSTSTYPTETDVCLLISDITLSLLRVFDPSKMEVLCEAASSENDNIAVRAVTAIDIACRRYGMRLPYYPELQARLRLLGEDTAFLDILADVELQFVRSRDTEEIERRMRDEIIPSMLRSPKAKGKHIITPEDLTDESNPEWNNWLKESGLEDSLRELTELQMSGSDVYMATFSHLKDYPFFQDTANWFRPFDPTHPAISHLFATSAPSADAAQTSPSAARKNNDSPLLQSLIMKSGMFCNSDKYSFCLSLATIPANQLEMLESQFREQEDALREELNEREGHRPSGAVASKPSTRTLVRQYIQDLYRFFHLSVARTSYADPFAQGGSQAADDPLYRFFHLPKNALLALFELNFQRHDFTSALDGWDILERDYPDFPDSTLWQKNGYCHQKTGNLDAALHAFGMADLLKPNQYWTLHHIAQCQRALGQTSEALDSYRHLAAMKPDNTLFIYRQAECLMSMEQYEDALTLLYRLAYETPDSARTQRALIRCQLMLHHPDAALKVADHLLADTSVEMTDDEVTLVGTAQWLCGNRDVAIHTFALADNLPSPAVIQHLGITPEDTPFLLDLVRIAQKDSPTRPSGK